MLYSFIMLLKARDDVACFHRGTLALNADKCSLYLCVMYAEEGTNWSLFSICCFITWFIFIVCEGQLLHFMSCAGCIHALCSRRPEMMLHVLRFFFFFNLGTPVLNTKIIAPFVSALWRRRKPIRVGIFLVCMTQWIKGLLIYFFKPSRVPGRGSFIPLVFFWS